MFLVLGEKPSVAQALAEVLGAKKRADGYLEGEDCIVSWCLGLFFVKHFSLKKASEFPVFSKGFSLL